MAADPNELSKKQERALRVAAKDGGPENLALVRSLLASGVNVDACGADFKRTALHLACQYGHEDIVRALLEAGASILLKDKDNCTPRKLAEKAGHQNVVDILVNHISEKEVTLIEAALESIKEECTLKDVDHKKTAKLAKQLEALFAINRQKITEHLNKLLDLLLTPELDKIKILEKELILKRDLLPEFLEHAFKAFRKLILFSGLTSLNISDKKEVDRFTPQVLLASYLRLEMQFKDLIKQIEEELTIILKTSTALKRKTIKNIQHYLSEISTLIKNILRPFQAECFRLMGEPAGYLEFLREYFPNEETLDNLGEKLSCAVIKWQNEKNRDDLDRCENVILDIIECYFERCKMEFMDFLRSDPNKTEHLFSVSTSTPADSDPTFSDRHTESCQAVEKHFSALIDKEMNLLRYNFETVADPVDGSVLPSALLIEHYLRGKKLILLLKHYLKNVGEDSKKTFDQKCAGLKIELSRIPNLKEPPADWVSVRAKEIEAQKALNRAQENKRRAENQAQRETSQLRAFNLKQQQLAEEKLQGEIDEIRKKMLGYLKEDAESIEVLEGVLGGNTRLKQVAFFKLVKILKIPGSETIPDTNSPPEDNKLTLHHKPRFESFTVHCRHGKDRAEWIHPNAVKCLKELMNKFGIKQDNFRKLLETAVKSQVKASVT